MATAPGLDDDAALAELTGIGHGHHARPRLYKSKPQKVTVATIKDVSFDVFWYWL